MPWRGPEVPGEFPTLGYGVADWIEGRCAIPDGERVGDPYLLTDEMVRFLLHFYRLTDDGEFFYTRGGQLVRPQKWGKGPFSAAIICAEAEGPVRFAGWSDGEPLGRPVPTPLIQVTAVSEDQTENVYSALLPMIELGALHGEIEDTGLGRINLPGGGQINPVTASARSRLGQRVTFAVQDETHAWTKSNRGRALADNQRRNIAGKNGRWMETTNAWDPTEESVAQHTFESPEEREGVYVDMVEPPEGLSIRNKVERRRALKIVYGDSFTGRRDGKAKGVAPWINLDRIEAEIRALLKRDAAQAERYFLNRITAAEAKAFSGASWDQRADTREPEDGAFVTIGVDGARFVDAIGMVATEVETGFQWPLGIWERPENAQDGYEHPFDEVDGAMTEAFERYEVWRAYCDPQWIDHLVDKWQGQWGDKRVISWYTNRPRQIAFAVSNFTDAISSGDLSHDGDPLFTRHIKNAVRQKLNVYDDEHRQMHTISKDRPDSPRKIDAAMAAVISWEARGDAIADGARPVSREAYFA